MTRWLKYLVVFLYTPRNKCVTIYDMVNYVKNAVEYISSKMECKIFMKTFPNVQVFPIQNMFLWNIFVTVFVVATNDLSIQNM